MTGIDKFLTAESNLIDAVVAFLVMEDKVLLMDRIRGLGKGLKSGVGGKLEPGENHTHALIRELDEEIRVIVTEWEEYGRVRFVWEGKPHASMDVRIYLVTEWQGEPTETDVAKPKWYSRNQLPTSEMWVDNELWVPKVLDRQQVDLVVIYSKDNEISEYRFL